MKFKPGQSGNPGGRPILPAEMKARIADLTPKALDVLEGILKDKMAKDSDRIKAAAVILDRSLGKPYQAISLALAEKVEEDNHCLEITFVPPQKYQEK